MGLVFIALSVLCSLLLAQFLKVAENNKLNILRILVWNYLVAFLISFFDSGQSKASEILAVYDFWILIFVLVLGIIFITNLLVYSRSIHRVGMGISFAAMRMSLVFPIGVSLFLFGESIGWIKYTGIFLALASLLLMIPSIQTKKISGISDFWLPVLIFLMTGMADTGMKIYEQLFAHQLSENLFLSGIFLVSLLVGLAVIIIRKQLQFSVKELFLGLGSGIVNLYASIFLIFALKELPGSVVFPLINVTLVVLGTLVGIWMWKDQLNKKQRIGLATAIFSIFLLI